MTTLEVGKKLVEMCSKGESIQAIETLYSQDVVSVEAMSNPQMPAEMRGLQAVLGKSKWWMDNNTVHSASCEGPYPHGDRFIVRFKYDITDKNTNKRHQMDEMGLYTVHGGKVVHEEFFYVTA